MKKISMILLVALLLMAGCTQNAAFLKEPLIKTAEVTSYEGLTKIQLSTNVNPEDDETLRLILQMLKDGLLVKTQQKNMNEGNVSISLQESSSVLDTELWPHSIHPSIDLFVNESNLIVKSSVDEKYLGIANVTPSLEATDFNELLEQAFVQFIDEYDYTFKKADNLGIEKVQLPNETSIDATHIQISIDTEEALEVMIYTLENLAKFSELEALINYIAQTDALGAPELSADLNYESVKTTLLEMATELKAINVTELKESGFSTSIVLDFWVGPDQLIVQQGAKLSLSLPDTVIPEETTGSNPESMIEDPTDSTIEPTTDSTVQTTLESGEPIEFTLDILSQNWNHNQEISYEFPQADQIITEEQLIENPELLEHFAIGSPIGFFAELMAMPEDYDDQFELEQTFDDVTPGHWAFEEITTLSDFGIVEGKGNNNYKPGQNVTRAEFIKMMATFNGLEPSNIAVDFTDKAQIPTWARPYIGAAVEAGLIEGNGDGSLRPNEHISRAEMVTILVRGLEIPLEEEHTLTYDDSDTITSWAVPYAKTATSYGIVQGRDGNRFAPSEFASRAEAATVLYRVLFEMSW
jgi:hypothetical protein